MLGSRSGETGSLTVSKVFTKLRCATSGSYFICGWDWWAVISQSAVTTGGRWPLHRRVGTASCHCNDRPGHTRASNCLRALNSIVFYTGGFYDPGASRLCDAPAFVLVEAAGVLCGVADAARASCAGVCKGEENDRSASTGTSSPANRTHMSPR